VAREGRPDQVLRSTVTLHGWSAGSDEDVVDAIEHVSGSHVDLGEVTVPFAVLRFVLADEAEDARRRLRAAGGDVTVEEAWIGREQARDQRARPTCPSCGSVRTQPFAHAGPAARLNMACTDCGHLFRDRRP
jgi:hypothetical protein